MKKQLLLALALTLGLTACGSDAGEAPAQEEVPAVEAPAELVETTLEYCLEGEPVEEPATQYVGGGFTVDIPSEGWVRETDEPDGPGEYPAVSWSPAVNEDVELEIVTLTGKTVEEARQYILTEEDDYDLIEDQRGGLGGSDREDGDVLEVRFYETEGGVLAVLLSYPLEASGGFGVTLSAMADTFVLT